MYQKIEETFWTDPKVSNLPPHEKLLFIYLITNSHVHYSGLYYLPKPTIQEETGMTQDAINKGMVALTQGALIRYDTHKKIVWVINMARHQVQQGNKTNLILGFKKQFNRLHNSALIQDFLNHYRTLVNGILNPSEWDTDGIPESVTVTETETETKRVGHKQKKSPSTDDDFIQTLKNNPAYTGICINTELSKMDAWLSTGKGQRRRKTRGFIVNWLNKIDKPMPVVDFNAARRKELGL